MGSETNPGAHWRGWMTAARWRNSPPPCSSPSSGRDGGYGPLQPWGADHALLSAIHHGEFMLNGLRNRDLQALLYQQPAETAKERRRRSAAISRKLRMLRAHGLIQKVARTHRYQVTAEGRSILLSILTTARTSLQQLNQLDRKSTRLNSSHRCISYAV